MKFCPPVVRIVSDATSANRAESPRRFQRSARWYETITFVFSLALSCAASISVVGSLNTLSYMYTCENGNAPSFVASPRVSRVAAGSRNNASASGVTKACFPERSSRNASLAMAARPATYSMPAASATRAESRA